jgi:hypothetical protein
VRAFHPSAASAYTAVAHASTGACVPQTIYVDAAARGLDTAGDNLALPAAATTDIQGSPRRVDDPSAPDAGLGGSPQIDMGAYEYQTCCRCPCPRTWLRRRSVARRSHCFEHNSAAWWGNCLSNQADRLGLSNATFDGNSGWWGGGPM